MLKALLFSLLFHLGWPMHPANPFIQPGFARSVRLVESACRHFHPPGIPENLLNPQRRFPGVLWRQAAKQNGVDPVLLYSVTLFESSRRDSGDKVSPWPFALHFNRANLSIYASSIQEARFVLAHVTTENVDIGLGQVNYQSHKDEVRRAADLLDPAVNLDVAARILAEALRSTPDLELGVGHYHSRTKWRARAYGRKVLAIYRKLKGYLGMPEVDLAVNGQTPPG
jgi:hypothetical protein